MSKDTLFTNDNTSAAGPVDFVKDAFDDVTLPASNNTGFTSTASNNPLGFYFGNDDTPKLASKILYIKDIILVNDRSKWVNGGSPTYLVKWHEEFPAAQGYTWGDIQIDGRTGLPFILLKNGVSGTSFDGVGVTGNIRRVSWLIQPVSAAASSATFYLDGGLTTTTDYSTLSSDSDAIYVPKFYANNAQSSNQTNVLHDYRIIPQTQGMMVVGVIVYFENSGANIQVQPGTTYVDKTKSTTLDGATLSVPTFGSSLGGTSVIYKTQGSAYAMSSLSASTTISIAQGTTGTNIINVSAGHGSSFPLQSGIVVSQGTSMYIGTVQSISTDALTVFPTLGFGVSNTIYRSWLGGASNTINASLMTLAYSIDFATLPAIAGASIILDTMGNYNVWGSNYGVSALLSSNALNSERGIIFKGGSGFMQVDGDFQAAELEFSSLQVSGNKSVHATFGINGVITWSALENNPNGGKGKYTIFTDAGPGWNSFVMGAGATFGVAVSRINLYKKSRDMGVTVGALSEFKTNQALTGRTSLNSSLMALGLAKRVYSDQLFLKGPWVRGTTFGAAGGAVYYGASTNAVLNFTYYGSNFSIIGAAGGGTLTVNGVGSALNFNAITTASEGLNVIQYTVGSGATAQIQAIDFAATRSELKFLGNINPKTNPLAQTRPVKVKYSQATTHTVADSTFVIMNYNSMEWDSHRCFQTGADAHFAAPYTGWYTVKASIRYAAVAAADAVLDIFIYKNNIAVTSARTITGSATSLPYSIPITDDIFCNAGDRIDIRLLQNSGGPLNAGSAPSYNYVSIAGPF